MKNSETVTLSDGSIVNIFQVSPFVLKDWISKPEIITDDLNDEVDKHLNRLARKWNKGFNVVMNKGGTMTGNQLESILF